MISFCGSGVTWRQVGQVIFLLSLGNFPTHCLQNEWEHCKSVGKRYQTVVVTPFLRNSDRSLMALGFCLTSDFWLTIHVRVCYFGKFNLLLVFYFLASFFSHYSFMCFLWFLLSAVVFMSAPMSRL